MIRYTFWLLTVLSILIMLVISVSTRNAALMLPYLLMGMPAAYHLGKAGARIRGRFRRMANRITSEASTGLEGLRGIR